MMNSLKLVFVLTFVAFVSANPHPEQFEEIDQTDAGLFRQFIECARLAIVTGIPEIGVPSHDPLIITHDIRQEFNEPGILTGFFSMENMIMKDIPNWEVRQFDELSADENGVDIFNYTIYWRDMVFTGDWKYSLSIFDHLLENEGTLTFELDHINFFGIFNFTKSGPTRSQTINDLGLHISTEEAHIDITNIGDKSGILKILDLGVVALVRALNDAIISDALKTKLITDWILKQERLDAIITNCQK